MNVLITGGSGFVGGHLRKLLEERGDSIIEYSLRDGRDLRDYEQIRNLLDTSRPHEIYHLAAQAYVPESMTNPQRTFEVNTIGSVNLLEAVRQLGLKTRILLAGTSEEYGDAVPSSGQVTEETMPNPLSPYAVSKLAMDYVGRWYAKSYGMDVVVTRAYNHAGPGRGEMYAESSFAKQIAEIEKGKRDKILHGNLESVRNYTDVRDVVRAYTMAIKLPSGVYNICSDNNVKISEILGMLVDEARCEIKTEINKALYRPSDFSFYPPSCEKFKKLTGWGPEIELKKTMNDILNNWRGRV